MEVAYATCNGNCKWKVMVQVAGQISFQRSAELKVCYRTSLDLRVCRFVNRAFNGRNPINDSLCC